MSNAFLSSKTLLQLNLQNKTSKIQYFETHMPGKLFAEDKKRSPSVLHMRIQPLKPKNRKVVKAIDSKKKKSLFDQ